MLGIADLYNTLFTIQVAFVGIAVAAVIAIIQVLQSVLTFRGARKLLVGPKMIIFGAMLLIGLGLTATSSLLTSLVTYNYFSGLDFNSERILQEPYFVLALILFMLTSIIYFAYIVYSYTKYLISSEALEFFIKNYDRELLKQYLSYRHSIPPNPPNKLSASLVLEGEVSQKDDKAFRQLQKQYESDLENYKISRKNNRGVESPLAPIEAYIFQSIQKSDSTLLIRSLMGLEAIYLQNPDDSSFIDYYCEISKNAIELSLSQGLFSSNSHVVDSIERIANDAISNDELNNLSIMLDLMKDVGDLFKTKDQESFKRLMNAFRNLGERLFETDTTYTQERIDDIIRNVGWLGERMIADMKGIEQTPLMFSGHYETRLSALTNCLWGIGQKFDTGDSKGMRDIRIFLDAMFVIARALEENYEPMQTLDQDNQAYESQYFSLMHEHERLFELSMRMKNKRNATLAVIKLKSLLELTHEAYDESRDDESATTGLLSIPKLYDDVREKWHKDTLNSLFRIGAMAARFKSKLGKPEKMLIHTSYIDEIVSMLEKYSRASDLEHEAREALIKCGPENSQYEAVKAYIKKVGAYFGTTFGMNLD